MPVLKSTCPSIEIGSMSASENEIRLPAVAGYFYPEDTESLRHEVQQYLSLAERICAIAPKAIVAPHAGYVYSGAIAAAAYRQLESIRDRVRRVVLLGPAHRVPLRGAALSPAKRFLTPLGPVNVDLETVQALSHLDGVVISALAHAQEHSLEVHLPFLQTVLDDFKLVPMLFGSAAPEWVASILERLWGGEETLIVVSTDLSHYHDYERAKVLDARCVQAITALDSQRIGPHDACGCVALNGLLELAQRRGLMAQVLDVRNSGDTSGARDRVVGYGAIAFHPAEAAHVA
jgi:AmmeMemoRadiSam system protein B